MTPVSPSVHPETVLVATTDDKIAAVVSVEVILIGRSSKCLPVGFDLELRIHSSGLCHCTGKESLNERG